MALKLIRWCEIYSTILLFHLLLVQFNALFWGFDLKCNSKFWWHLLIWTICIFAIHIYIDFMIKYIICKSKINNSWSFIFAIFNSVLHYGVARLLGNQLFHVSFLEGAIICVTRHIEISPRKLSKVERCLSIH